MNSSLPLRLIYRRPVFSGYRKRTNNEDFINCFSAHNERTKEGVVIVFFLRALRSLQPGVPAGNSSASVTAVDLLARCTAYLVAAAIKFA